MTAGEMTTGDAVVAALVTSPWSRGLERAEVNMPNGRKRKRKKIATHKRKKRLRKNRHKKK